MNHAPLNRPMSAARCGLAVFASLFVLGALPGSPLSAQMPDGWQLRLDRPNMDAAEVSFMTMGDGFHVTTGPATILWNADNSVSGPFRAEVEMTQMVPAAHPEAYGLFVGGENLDGAAQSYVYFLVRQDGSYMITHRVGTETHSIQGWTPNPAVRAMDDGQRLTNRLAIEADGDEVTFHVNGTQVEAYSNRQMATDGIVGLRVNHGLELLIADFQVARR
jgi:hypothetical protein